MTDGATPVPEVDDNDPPKHEEPASQVQLIVTTVPGPSPAPKAEPAPQKAPKPQKAGEPQKPPEKPAEPSEPFWNSKAFIAFMTGMLTAIPAITVAVVTHLNNEAQIQLARDDHEHTQALALQEQQHKIRMDYFSRAIDPVNDAEYRQRVLRFLVRDEHDQALSEWAQVELNEVAPEAAALRARLEAAEAQIAATEAQVTAAETAQRDALERAQRLRAASQHEIEYTASRACSAESRPDFNACLARCPHSRDGTGSFMTDPCMMTCESADLARTRECIETARAERHRTLR